MGLIGLTGPIRLVRFIGPVSPVSPIGSIHDTRGKTMKVRHRKRTHRSKRATAPAPPPPDLTTEIEQSVEARDKLEVDAARFKAERDQLKSAFLRSFASEMSAVVMDAYRALEGFAAWQAQEARAPQAADALNQLSSMFQERVAQ